MANQRVQGTLYSAPDPCRSPLRFAPGGTGPRLSAPLVRPPAPAEQAAGTDGPSARSSAAAPFGMRKE
jgi:hypothetical protein